MLLAFVCRLTAFVFLERRADVRTVTRVPARARHPPPKLMNSYGFLLGEGNEAEPQPIE